MPNVPLNWNSYQWAIHLTQAAPISSIPCGRLCTIKFMPCRCAILQTFFAIELGKVILGETQAPPSGGANGRIVALAAIALGMSLARPAPGGGIALPAGHCWPAV